MSEKPEQTKAESQSDEVTAPIVEEPSSNSNNGEPAEVPKAEEAKPEQAEAQIEEVKEHIEVVPSGDAVQVSETIQHAEHSEKKQETAESESHTQEDKSKESTAEVAVNDESLKVETKSEQTTSEEKTEDKVVTKRTTRGRVSRTAKSGNAVSTETVEVVEEKKPVEEKTEEKEAEEKAVETPKRGRGRQPKRKATSPPQKSETPKKTKIESPSEEQEAQKDKDVPLLEQSLTVEGKRQRKTTQRLELNVKESSSKHSYTPQGKGKALGDIARICHFIDKTTADSMRQLYRLCMGYNPKHKEIKKTLKTFNGFEFERDSADYERKAEFLDKITVSGLKQMCDVLDLERSGNKEALRERIMEFLMEPVDSGRPVPATKARGRAKGRPKSKKGQSEESMEVEESDDSDESHSQADDSKEVEQEPAEDENKEQNDQETDKDDQPPSQDELKKTIKEIIDMANLDKVTMKKVIQDVYAKYPQHNLNDQKSLIKKFVKELLEVQ